MGLKDILGAFKEAFGSDICPVCQKKIQISKALADGKIICVSCWEKPRAMYPLQYVRNPEYDDYMMHHDPYYNKEGLDVTTIGIWKSDQEELPPDEYVTVDPIKDLMFEDFLNAWNGADTYEAELRNKNGGYRSAFYIREVEPVIDRTVRTAMYTRVRIKEEGALLLKGMVGVGSIGGAVREGFLIHNGAKTQVKIILCYYPYGYYLTSREEMEKKGCFVGREAGIVICGANAHPGDILVQEGESIHRNIGSQ